MNIEKQFLKTIKKYNMVKKGDKIIVGVSGGPDSVCLLHLFNKFRNELGVFLYVAHLDHMFRGKESEEDARFVETLCYNWNIPFFSDKVDAPSYAKNLAFLLKMRLGALDTIFLGKLRSKLTPRR